MVESQKRKGRLSSLFELFSRGMERGIEVKPHPVYPQRYDRPDGSFFIVRNGRKTYDSRDGLSRQNKE